MTSDDILRAFDRMRVWRQGDRRAVHKPLLVLYALAKVGAGGTATMDWNRAEPRLVATIARHGLRDIEWTATVETLLDLRGQQGQPHDPA